MKSHPHKTITNKEKFREKISQAAKILNEPVAATLGPDGLPILIKQYDGAPPKITKDGVTVADSLFVSDPTLDTIMQSIKEAARKTNTEAGDGTTTSVIYVNALIQESLKYIRSGAITPQRLKGYVQRVSGKIANAIGSMAKPISDTKEMFFVASISANGDEEIADSIVKAAELAGEHGLTTIEEGYSSSIEVKHIDGFYMNSGFQKLGPLGASLITHHDKQEVIFDSPAVLVYDGDLNDANDLTVLYDAFSRSGTKVRPLVILAYSFGDIVMQAIALSRKVGVNLLPIVCPTYSSASVRRLFLDDFSAYTGAITIDSNPDSIALATETIEVQNGEKKEKRRIIKKEYFGAVSKTIMRRDVTICYNGAGDHEEIKVRLAGLKTLEEQTEVPYEKDIFRHRLAMLSNGIVQICVGGHTELEMKEKKDRVIDAQSAVKSAIEMGIVPGGGTVGLKMQALLKQWAGETNDEAEKIAYKILSSVFTAPIRQLCENMGEPADVLIDKIISTLPSLPNAGLDARNKVVISDMLEAGIIDSAKVAYCAFKNATSIALELLSGGGGVVFGEAETKEKPDIDGFYYNE